MATIDAIKNLRSMADLIAWNDQTAMAQMEEYFSNVIGGLKVPTLVKLADDYDCIVTSRRKADVIADIRRKVFATPIARRAIAY